ncbi:MULTISPECIES: RinA family phage transcriptional regulator [Thermoactinomyces]|uniref:Transcriptional regulator n=1 Tax=Thermoactinomyces daqus TaxID=1329516 RepID=A0A7W2AJN7_9BACL|nr:MULTISPECIES: RinA family phage transcriptional regulator [Thermoactinomyces]MBA4543974.1 transcriptional regulator [Thermoactinomyces daqus]MBH8599093.1 transcriptional regulator [Thermoactinomyces sp. CICC 10523]MBH8607976.1 transcriptional regulator [Thermoactinomyces sp. CICC 10521]
MGVPREEKLKTGTFKHIESELYSYWDTVKEVRRLRAEILHSTPYFENIGGGRTSLPSDPTGKTVTLLIAHRRIEQLEKIVEAIRTVYDRLPEEKKKLVQLKYWTTPQELTWEGIARQIPVSRRTAIAWRDEIVLQIANQLGWR